MKLNVGFDSSFVLCDFEAAFADIAKRADDVCPYVNLHGCSSVYDLQLSRSTTSSLLEETRESGEIIPGFSPGD